MKLMVIKTFRNPLIENFLEQMKDLNLRYYASDAASEMEFEDIDELYDAVKRSMELCVQAGIPIDENFKGIYKSYYNGITADWKLSNLGYGLVCINGKTNNTQVALRQIQLLKNVSLNK